MDDLDTLVSKVKTISSLPDIFVKINNLTNDPASSVSNLAKVIESDQALTTKLLQLANSAFYGFPGKVSTISKAVTIIGFKQLRELVLAVSVRSLFNGFNASPINMKSFWEHSVACGITARTLAIYNGDKQPESYFIAGFLHDLGRLILLEQYPKKYAQAFDKAKNEQCLLYDVEHEVFGFTHADVGGALINYWQLPGSLAEAVKFHHNPGGQIDDSDLTAIIHIADIITHASYIGFSGETFVPPLNKNAWKKSKMNQSILETVIQKALEQYSDMIAFLMGGIR